MLLRARWGQQRGASGVDGLGVMIPDGGRVHGHWEPQCGRIGHPAPPWC